MRSRRSSRVEFFRLASRASSGSEIVLDGRQGNFASNIGAAAFQADEFLQRAFFSPPVPEGNTGEVTVNAGQLEVNASEVLVEDGASILATTASGRGGKRGVEY